MGTQYWYCTDGENRWNTLEGNWWDDAAHTQPSAALPDASTDVVILASPAHPYVQYNYWTPPHSINSTADTIEFTDGSHTDNALTITGPAQFRGGSYNAGKIIGDALFDNQSSNQDERVIGNAIFTRGSANRTTIQGNAIFIASRNESFCNANAAFHDGSINISIVSGNASFDTNSRNSELDSNGQKGTIYGNATFSLSCFNGGDVHGAITHDELRLATLLDALSTGRVALLDRLDAPVSSRPSAADVAAAVWGYGARTLSSFGTLVGNIWSAATRTITGGGGTTLAPATVAKLDGAAQMLLAAPYVPGPAPVVVIPQPAEDDSLCVVYVYAELLNNTKKAGITVTFQLDGPARSERMLDQSQVSMTTNIEGYAQITLQRTDRLTPTSRKYKVNCAELGVRNAMIPLTSATFDLSALIG